MLIYEIKFYLTYSSSLFIDIPITYFEALISIITTKTTEVYCLLRIFTCKL